jgi:peptidoglycan/LPS O-acetylase OafA/YrhL
MREHYYPHLDALRALAVMGPVFLHLWPVNVPDSPLTPRVTGIGFLGVELFFVISGFLITGILLRARDQAMQAGQGVGAVLRSFYARRALRIFPVYWATLLLIAIPDFGPVREHFWWEFLYLTNFRIVALQDWLGQTAHFWSLAVEEQFYLFWPLLILFLPRRLLLPAIASAVLIAPLFRWACLRYDSEYAAVTLMPGCLDVLGLGAMLAWLRHHRAEHPLAFARFTRVAGIAGLIGTVIHLAWYLRSPDAWVAAWPLARTSYGLLFVALVDRAARGFTGPLRHFAELRPVVYLGTISYAVYLFHPFAVYLPSVMPSLTGFALGWPLVYFGLQFAVTVGCAAVSWKVLEKPVNELRRYFPYARDLKP